MYAKKSLGQNFLKSAEALRKMILAAKIEPGDIVLEVGPGKGALTKKLLEAGATVHAIEKDDRLIEVLQTTFQEAVTAQKLFIHHADALEFEPSSIDATAGKYKIVANIPYYITGQFFKRFLTHEIQPSLMVIMVQKEVAERIAARDNKESVLSLSVKAYGTPRYVMTVQSKYFSPEPNVDSAVIAVENISRDFFSDVSEDKFFEIIKAGFAHKRKILIGNLSNILPRERLEKIFIQNKIPGNVRAEDITMQDWRAIILAL